MHSPPLNGTRNLPSCHLTTLPSFPTCHLTTLPPFPTCHLTTQLTTLPHFPTSQLTTLPLFHLPSSSPSQQQIWIKDASPNLKPPLYIIAIANFMTFDTMFHTPLSRYKNQAYQTTRFGLQAVDILNQMPAFSFQE